MVRMIVGSLALVLAAASAQAQPQRVTFALGTNDPEVRALAEKGVLMLVPAKACEGAVLVFRDYSRGSQADPAFRYECRDAGQSSVVYLDASSIRAFDPSTKLTTDRVGNRPVNSGK